MDACLHWHGVRARVELVVVMPDHVHMLIHPHPKPEGGCYYTISELLHSVKSYTAHRILKQRGQRGPLWQDESYDRLIRSEKEFIEKYNYFLENPVRKGLVKRPGDYPFTHSPAWDLTDLQATTGGRPLGTPLLEVERARERERHRRDACATGATDVEVEVFATTWGRFEGWIAHAPRGRGGFGYDPLFLLPAPDTRTSAELSPFEKNDMSHRGKAARAMAEELRRLGFAPA
jgi:REP element-mobilizing transposase RayT